ncbi:MAG TPA: hypothetical protein DIC23_12185, partial [Planctomycetaceae bacterium]|nr:hypothetical protein [Planctomycetaceae bacterium]
MDIVTSSECRWSYAIDDDANTIPRTLMMKLLDRLERHFGRFAIPNLSLLIVVGQGIVLLLTWMDGDQPGGGGIIPDLQLKGTEVLAGEWWRL